MPKVIRNNDALNKALPGGLEAFLKFCQESDCTLKATAEKIEALSGVRVAESTIMRWLRDMENEE